MTELIPSPLATSRHVCLCRSHCPHPISIPRWSIWRGRELTRSQRTMRAALNIVATLLDVPTVVDEAGREVTFLHCNWAALRYQHTVALRAALVQQYEPATANVKIAALRGVLQEAWRW